MIWNILMALRSNLLVTVYTNTLYISFIFSDHIHNISAAVHHVPSTHDTHTAADTSRPFQPMWHHQHQPLLSRGRALHQAGGRAGGQQRIVDTLMNTQYLWCLLCTTFFIFHVENPHTFKQVSPKLKTLSNW